jgi:hypothetical protein
MSITAPPQTPQHGVPDFPPAPEPKRGRLFAWVARKPKTAFWVILITGFMLGGVIGASGQSTDTTKLDAQTRRADAAQATAARLRSQLDAATGRAQTAEAKSSSLADQVASLSAKGEVPGLVGMSSTDARSDGTVSTYHWRVNTVRRVSSHPAGEVLSQSPKEGTVLKAGRSITIVVAKPAPPKPKQWVTVKTLQGASSTKTEEFTIPSGAKARLVYSMPQDGNNAIELYRAPSEYVDLLLNEIGPQQGSTRMYESGTYYLDVSGAYTIQVQVFKRPN